MRRRTQSFIDEYRRILAAFDDYLGSAPASRDGLEQGDLIAYFCAEYGWHESFPIYSGGLGVLAGDHCKTASDLDLPFVAVGLLYRHGYFHQRIDRSGQQVPDYPPIDPRSAPLSMALNPDGSEVRVDVPRARAHVAVRVWKAPVGRVTVLLLDTDVPENVAEDRLITGTLYGGSNELRQQQEAVLGIGGVRALRALGLEPTVWHINEGHAAFLRARAAARAHDGRLAVRGRARSDGRQHGVHDAHARQRRSRRVSARPRCAAVRELRRQSSASRPEQLLDLGRAPERPDVFNMTRLALRGSAAVNGVSKIHGQVSSRLVRERLARRASGREPDGLRHERRARGDVPAAHLGEALRSASRRGLARAHDGPRAARSHRGDPRRVVLGDEPEGQEPDVAACCASGSRSSINATV